MHKASQIEIANSINSVKEVKLYIDHFSDLTIALPMKMWLVFFCSIIYHSIDSIKGLEDLNKCVPSNSLQLRSSRTIP